MQVYVGFDVLSVGGRLGSGVWGVAADGVRWWRHAVPGVPDGALARAQRPRGREARALAQPLLLGGRRQPAAAPA